MFYRGVLIVSVLVLVAGCSAVTAQNASTGGGPNISQAAGSGVSAAASRGITVVGSGTASGVPNVAYVTVGVETQSDSVQQAVDDNGTKMAALLDSLKALGIADKDIRTTNYSLFTQRPSEIGPNGTTNTGPIVYHVTNQANLTIRDVSKLGDVLDKAVAAGANNIYGVSFGVDDPSQLQADARAKAMTDAKARAESLAKLAGVTLGDVESITENATVSGPILASAAAGLGGGGTPIQPGQLDVSVSVQVTYAIQ